jgi:hypothetical protein
VVPKVTGRPEGICSASDEGAWVMTDDVVTLPRMDLYFGNCPQCHKTHGCYSVGPDHWYVCHTHHTKW